MWQVFGIIASFAVLIKTEDLPCNAVEKEAGFVCMCNASYCDSVEAPAKLEKDQFHVYSTSNSSPGFNHRIGSFRMQAFAPHGIKLEINDKLKRQKILGIGGAFTDSFGYVLESLSNDARNHLLKSYFSPDGVEYSFCRVVVGSSDFSIRNYNYAPEYDPSLKSFNLTEDDYRYKISVINEAQSMSRKKINLMSSIWTTPKWMRMNNGNGVNYLKPEFRQTWADYYIKILDAYKENGIEFWGLTPVNEPITLLGFKNVAFDNLGMFPEDQRNWIADNLGPSLEDAGYENVTVVLLDDMRKYALWYMDTVMRNKKCQKYVAGIGLHFYMDSQISPKLLDILNEKYPQKGIYYTESSINPFMGMMIDLDRNITEGIIFPNGSFSFKRTPPLLGSWQRAAYYIENIIENLNHWVTGYMDWNLALDLDGGPNLGNMTCDAAVVVNDTADEFYKQPMFYGIGHFSKFLQPGAVMLDSTIDLRNVENNEDYETAEDSLTSNSRPIIFRYKDVIYAAALNPDGSHTIFIYNPKKIAVEISFHDETLGYGFIVLEPESINTVVY